MNFIFGCNLDENIDENDIEEKERNVAEENSNAGSSVAQNEVRAVLDDIENENAIVTDEENEMYIHLESDSVEETIDVEDPAEIVDNVINNEVRSVNENDQSMFEDSTSVNISFLKDNHVINDERNEIDDSILQRIDSITDEIEKGIKTGNDLLNDDDPNDNKSDKDDVEYDSLSNESTGNEVTNIRPKRQCVGKGIDHLDVNFNNKTYTVDKHIQLMMKSTAHKNS